MKSVLMLIMAGVIAMGLGLSTVRPAEASSGGAFVAGAVVGYVAGRIAHPHCRYGRRHCHRRRSCHYHRGRYHCHQRTSCHRHRYCR
ncbi:MAG: hypothetical protein OEM91_02595 [Hyphomicrobiales bacterium]|nr:hypothetical protein [Hyphomicrobiales bacterium]